MIDFHYDLLTKLYISYLNNDFKEAEEICKAFRLNNIRALVANLCFETEEEMKKEYHKDYWNPNVGIKEMFYIATTLVSSFVNSDISVYYSIEGCDYVEIDDLEELYEMGLRVILPVWNHQNQYGSGNRTDCGLTKKGEELIKKAVSLGIAIDLSHANEETFDGIINIIETLQKEKQKVIFFASHSNVRSLCNRKRNLTDKQLLQIKRLGGKVGIFSNRNFVVENALKNKIGLKQLKQAYLEHIKYVEELFGGIDSIVLSTDDMGWDSTPSGDLEFSELAIYPCSSILNEIRKTLMDYYSEEDIERLLYKNGRETLIKLEEGKYENKIYKKGWKK